MNSEIKLIKSGVGLLNLAEQLNNVTRAYKLMDHVAFAKLYTSKHAITSADVLNDRVIPFFEEHEIPELRMLTDREPISMEGRKIMNTNFVCNWKTLTKARQRYGIHKAMESVNDCTGQCKMCSTLLPSEENSIMTWKPCNRVLMNGSGIITWSDQWQVLLRKDPSANLQ